MYCKRSLFDCKVGKRDSPFFPFSDNCQLVFVFQILRQVSTKGSREISSLLGRPRGLLISRRPFVNIPIQARKASIHFEMSENGKKGLSLIPIFYYHDRYRR